MAGKHRKTSIRSINAHRHQRALEINAPANRSSAQRPCISDTRLSSCMTLTIICLIHRVTFWLRRRVSTCKSYAINLNDNDDDATLLLPR